MHSKAKRSHQTTMRVTEVIRILVLFDVLLHNHRFRCTLVEDIQVDVLDNACVDDQQCTRIRRRVEVDV